MATNPVRNLARGLVFAAALGCSAPALLAQAPPAAAPQAAGQKGNNDVLPLTRVVMFNAGLGYFEHRGQVEGDAKVELRFRTGDINDLLKSMILEDKGGGTIATVSYGSRDPISKTLKTFPIDLNENPSMYNVLAQVRGERVQIEAVNTVVGVLVGVEKRKREIGSGRDVTIVESEFANLLTEEGLRSIPLENVTRIKLLNEKLDADLRKALDVLSKGHDVDKKSVTLSLQGQGARPIRVAYIQETPIWKTSYRLVLDEQGDPFLQGWAIVENTTEEDWNNIALTLVSGRPIAYRMDLYAPLYSPRPMEHLNLFASLRPQTYGQDMAKANERFAEMAEPKADFIAGDGRAMDRVAGVAAGARGGGGGGGRGGRAGGAPGAAPRPAQPMAPATSLAMDSDGAEESAFRGADIARQSAQGGEVGELFQYSISAPVSLGRQKSAMLPIVNETVKGEKLSIYNEAVQSKHPLNGLRLVNSTSLHLMQGPVTVFDGGAYAGDAKIDDLAPKVERLISYALDLKTEVAPEGKSKPETIESVRLRKGIMEISRKYSRGRQYTVKNSDAKPKTVLIEYNFDPNWKLTVPKEATEKTRDRYRFAVKAEPGKPAVLNVEEEQVISEQVAITNLDDNGIVYYMNQKDISPAVKSALEEVVKRKQAIERTTREKQRKERQVTTISQDQARVRENMKPLDKATDLFKRYTQDLNRQEDEIASLRTQIQTLSSEETQQRQALDDYLLKLDVK